MSVISWYLICMCLVLANIFVDGVSNTYYFVVLFQYVLFMGAVFVIFLVLS